MRHKTILTLDRRGFLTPPKKAFSTIEYALLIAVAVAALITMSIYIKRAVSGRFKDTADSFGFGRQYEPEPGVTVETIQKRQK